MYLLKAGISVCGVLCLVLMGCEQQSDVDRIKSANQTVAARDIVPTATVRPAISEQHGGDSRTPLSIYELRQGDCFSYGSESPSEANTYEEVFPAACASDDWDWVVSDTFVAAGKGVYPGEEHFFMLGYQRCPRSDDIQFPTAGSWDAGDRVVTCLESRTLDAFDLESGECFRFLDESIDVERVSCQGNWEYRILEQLSFDTPYSEPYPGDAFFDQEFDRRCPPRSNYLVYSPETWWETGTRLMACIEERNP